MNRRELKNYVGAFALVVLVVMAAGGWWFGRPITDRTLAIFAVVLWATLQLDITALLPFDIVPPADDEGED
ncbi:hypothetical protein [Halococcus saccharolyticus]|uniref:Uncharacterized protein n=1 Tax=Halococcus saccharolyticus DSM 5350 TaxID=1227455 RepID=M0MA98_9EURY|nr:hypothetical protein [Halococcus saccharolyticus]EMA42671.1 hypothetical protein C449_16053 [Halococcus saccharolyticus DSM 5350]